MSQLASLFRFCDPGAVGVRARRPSAGDKSDPVAISLALAKLAAHFDLSERTLASGGKCENANCGGAMRRLDQRVRDGA